MLFAVEAQHVLEIETELTWNMIESCGGLQSVSAQAEIGAVIQRSCEVRMKRLDNDSQGKMRKAMSTDIQAWLKYHAVQAALRSNYADKKRQHEYEMDLAVQGQRRCQGTPSDHRLQGPTHRHRGSHGGPRHSPKRTSALLHEGSAEGIPS